MNNTAVKLHMRTVMDDLLLQTRKIKVRRSFLQFLKLEVSKAETHTHWCSGLYPPSVSLHSYFFYTLHCGVMKSSVNLGVLAVIILCCVHGGVAGKYRGKCVRKGRTRATQDICDDHRSMFITNSRLCSRSRTKGFIIFLYRRNKASALKTVGISHSKIKPRFNLKNPYLICFMHGNSWDLIFFSLLDTRSESLLLSSNSRACAVFDRCVVANSSKLVSLLSFVKSCW